jgi:hypothetical protein
MNKAENLFMNIWVKLTAILFLRQHENNETYKTEQETFLREGLQRYVCYSIKNQQAFLNRRAFLCPHPLKRDKAELIKMIYQF